MTMKSEATSGDPEILPGDAETEDLLNPPCAGVRFAPSPDICPRCGATENDTCGDHEAQTYQTRAREASHP